MIKTISQQLTLLAAGTIISSVALATPTHANTIRYQFTTTIIESLFLEAAPEIGLKANPDFYTGLFKFDESLLTGIGLESIPVSSVALQKSRNLSKSISEQVSCC